MVLLTERLGAKAGGGFFKQGVIELLPRASLISANLGCDWVFAGGRIFGTHLSRSDGTIVGWPGGDRAKTG